jgi:hypothetical protein
MPTESQLVVPEVQAPPANTGVDPKPIPVRYEEVTLTEEAAEIIERERLAAAARPPRPVRRLSGPTAGG